MHDLLYPRFRQLTAYYAGGPLWQRVEHDVSDGERDRCVGKGPNGFRAAKVNRWKQQNAEHGQSSSPPRTSSLGKRSSASSTPGHVTWR